MKKIFCLLFIIAALLGLAACGECSHESWLEASCTESARCADCGITEGEPLGHSPSEPSCTEPGLCTLCGEAVAEPIPHSYGAWEIKGEEMSHVSRDDVDPRGMEALAALPGTWRSETFREARYAESGEKISEETVETDEFYIEFTEDWHFKAHIDKDYEGRYFLYSVVDNTYSEEEFAYIAIYLMPDKPEPGKEIIRGEMYYYPDGLANAFRVYMRDNYENGKLEYSGVYSLFKT